MNPEEKIKLIERKLTAALKAVEDREAPPPNALLFLEWEETAYDYDIPAEICGLPVFINPGLDNNTAVWRTISIPWIPIWNIDNAYISLKCLDAFNDAYEDVD